MCHTKISKMILPFESRRNWGNNKTPTPLPCCLEPYCYDKVNALLLQYLACYSKPKKLIDKVNQYENI